MTKRLLNIENYNIVLAAVKANNGVIGDDHNNGNGTLKAVGVAALVNGDRVTPVVLANSRYFSLNLLYVDEAGKPRVSRSSVGGVLMPMNHGYKLDRTVAAFNLDQVDNEWTMGSLQHVEIFNNDVTSFY